MKLKHLLIINAVIAVAYGLGELLVPATMFSMHGIANNPSASLLGRYFGSANIGIGMLAWFARNVADPEAQWAIILAFLIYHIIGFIVSVSGTVSGIMSIMGLVPVGIFLILALGYAYFLFRRPQPAA